MYKIALFALIVIAVTLGGYVAYESPTQKSSLPTSPSAPSASGNTFASVEDYVRANISALSPIKETLGGTFYVTEIEIEPEESKGNVEYEDGHNAYKAEFTYAEGMSTGYTITSFVVKK